MKNIQVPATVKSVNHTICEALVEFSTGKTMIAEFDRDRFEKITENDITVCLIVVGAEVIVAIDISGIEVAMPTSGTIVSVDTTNVSDEWFESRQDLNWC